MMNDDFFKTKQPLSVSLEGESRTFFPIFTSLNSFRLLAMIHCLINYQHITDYFHDGLEEENKTSLHSWLEDISQ